MEFSELERALFVAALVWAAVALVVTCVALGLAKRQVGRTIHAARGSRHARWAAVAFGVAVAISLLLADRASTGLGLGALALALSVALLAPNVEDRVLGEHGARHGLRARNWHQLEGWRLTGSHLRFLVHGELLAVEVPPSEMEPLRTKLEQLCPATRNDLGLAAPGESP